MANEPAHGLIDEHLARARSGDQTGFSALIRAHQRAIYNLALRMLGSREAAEDLTQDVFMHLSSHMSAIESTEHLSFWLRRVTANRAIDILRQRTRFPTSSLEDEAELLCAAPDADPLLQRHFQTLLAQLNPASRAVLLLRYQEDLDPADIARALDMPVNTVKSHLTRSLEWLRQQSTNPGSAVPAERKA